MSSLPKQIGRSSAIAALSAVTLALTGCSTFRPMPTHGGGKRFDEEQRLVSATIQHAADKMDFTRLLKSRVAIEVTSIPTSGNSNGSSYGGLKSIYGYNLQPRLDANKTLTRQDLEYLEKEIIRRLRFDGYQVTSPKDADIYLVVLVDSLGTNHIRKEYGILFRDSLAVSCEMTYYAIDAKTQKIIATARSVASIGDYREINVRFTPFSFSCRSLTDFRETIVPLPKFRYRAAGSYGVAHVDDLQFKPEPEKSGKGRKGGKGGGRAPQFNLPSEQMENGPDGELLPRLPRKAMSKQEKMSALMKKGFAAGKNKDANTLQQVIEDIREIKPEAPVIKKLETRLEKLREQAPKPAPAPGAPEDAEQANAPAPANRQEKMKTLIKQGYAAARAKDAAALQKTITEMRETKPDAKVIGKLEAKLKELNGGGAGAADDAEQPDQEKLPDNHIDASNQYRNLLPARYVKFNWWRDPEYTDFQDYYWHEDLGWPMSAPAAGVENHTAAAKLENDTTPASNDSVVSTAGYLDLPRH